MGVEMKGEGRRESFQGQVPGSATHRLFFAAACIHAVLSVGIWIFARPDDVGPGWHAHELVFGYVAAVIAGFLFTRTPLPVVLSVLLLWAAARLAWLYSPEASVANAALSVASTAAIGWIAGWSFLRGVKRGQNLVFPALLVAMAGCDAMSQLHVFGVDAAISYAAILLGLFAAVILIVVMGGRIAGAAFSGLMQRAGGARIAPRLRLEAALPFLIGGTALTMVAGVSPLILATLSWLAAAVLFIRIRDWWPAVQLAGPDLLALAAAQVFIALGLLGIGMRWLGPPWVDAAPLHLITIGGIGMATVTMMLKSAAQRERQPLPSRMIALCALLMGIAALARAGADMSGETAYVAAALAWCATMFGCLWKLLVR